MNFLPGLGCSGPCGNSRRAQITDWRAQRVGAVVCRADLDARGDVIDDADGLGVCEAGQRVWDDVKLHLPWRLRPCLLPIDGFAGGALQAAVLGRACWSEAPGVPHPGPSHCPTRCPAPTHCMHGSPPCGPPCCHWSTWPPGRAGGTCGRSGPGGPQARAAHSCSGAHPHNQML